jgi:hypothetical protein
VSCVEHRWIDMPGLWRPQFYGCCLLHRDPRAPVLLCHDAWLDMLLHAVKQTTPAMMIISPIITVNLVAHLGAPQR